MKGEGGKRCNYVIISRNKRFFLKKEIDKGIKIALESSKNGKAFSPKLSHIARVAPRAKCMMTASSGTGDVAQVTECLPSMHKVLGSIPSTIYTGQAGAELRRWGKEDQKFKITLDKEAKRLQMSKLAT